MVLLIYCTFLFRMRGSRAPKWSSLFFAYAQCRALNTSTITVTLAKYVICEKMYSHYACAKNATPQLLRAQRIANQNQTKQNKKRDWYYLARQKKCLICGIYIIPEYIRNAQTKCIECFSFLNVRRKYFN